MPVNFLARDGCDWLLNSSTDVVIARRSISQVLYSMADDGYTSKRPCMKRLPTDYVLTEKTILYTLFL